MLFRTIGIGVLPLAILFSCGKSSADRNDGLHGPRGTVQGVLVDALTGERIAIPAVTENQGVRVLTGHTYKAASPLTWSTDESSNQMVGEFFVHGVPINKRYPIVAQVEGYQTFTGYVEINADYKERTVLDPLGRPVTSDHLEDNPHMVANIRLFPLATEIADVNILVVQAGSPVSGALVHLTPRLENAFVEDLAEASRNRTNLLDRRGFLVPHDSRMRSLKGISSDEGIVSFSQDDIVLGGVYDLRIIPTLGSAEPVKEEITIGLRSASLSLVEERHHYVVSLTPGHLDTNVMYTNVSDYGYDTEGRLKVRFNRPIAITPASHESMYATLHNSVWARLPANLPNIGGPETMNYEIVGDTLTLSPEFKRSPDLKWETGLSISYHNVYLVPQDEPFGRAVNLTSILQEQGFGEASVNFLGESQPRPAPGNLNLAVDGSRRVRATLTSPFNASGRTGSFGYENGEVVITAETGELVITVAGQERTASSFKLYTDSQGEASKFMVQGEMVNTSIHWRPTNSAEPETYVITARDGLGKLDTVRTTQR